MVQHQPGIAGIPRSARWGPLIRSVFLARGGATVRRIRDCVVLTVLIVGLGLGVNRRLFEDRAAPLPNDQHALLSLEIAVNRIRSGVPSHCYDDPAAPGVNLRQLVSRDVTALGLPLRSLPERVSPSEEQYQSHLHPFLNNENSLMLLDCVLLRLMPDLSVNSLIRAHTVLKIACLAAFVGLLVRIGASFLFSLVVCHIGLLIIYWAGVNHPISFYPFLMPLTMLLIALLGLALHSNLHRRVLAGTAVLAVVGALVGGFVNGRTSYFPVVIALVLAYIVFAALDVWRDRTRRRMGGIVLALVPLLGLVAGWQWFTARWIKPLQAATAGCGPAYTYHVIGHPLVICLGTHPSSELARSEGISADDMVGLNIARRIDPAVQYLGPNYDNALLVYYLKLWLYHPEEMAAAYVSRLHFAGASAWALFLDNPLCCAGRSGCVVRLIGAPMKLWPDGAAYLGFFSVLALAGLVCSGRLGAATGFVLSAVGLSGLLLLLESALFAPSFQITYHGMLLMCILCSGLLVYQLAANGLSAITTHVVQRLRRPRLPARAHPSLNGTLIRV